MNPTKPLGSEKNSKSAPLTPKPPPQTNHRTTRTSPPPLHPRPPPRGSAPSTRRLREVRREALSTATSSAWAAPEGAARTALGPGARRLRSAVRPGGSRGRGWLGTGSAWSGDGNPTTNLDQGISKFVIAFREPSCFVRNMGDHMAKTCTESSRKVVGH